MNPSIKDMERKMTSLANTIYGLVLIVTAGTADVKVVTSLMLTMVMLLKAMNEEMMFLKQVLTLLALLVQSTNADATAEMALLASRLPSRCETSTRTASLLSRPRSCGLRYWWLY